MSNWRTPPTTVAALARQAAGEIELLVPALWLFFPINMILLGFTAAALQIHYLGFIPPTALLIVDAAVAGCAALVLPRAGESRT